MSRLSVVSAMLLAAFVTVTVLLLVSCGSDTLAGGASETGNSGVGVLRVETFDAPPPREVEHVYLALAAIEAHREDSGWMVVSNDTARIDFIALVNGRTALIVDTTVPSGEYDELRINLLDSNRIVVAGDTCPLAIPSGTNNGVRIHASFSVADEESTLLYVDFDISTSISRHHDQYRMVPSFTAYDASNCGRVAGNVRDSAGTALPNAVVRSVGTAENHATLSDLDGAYMLILPSGTYTFECTADDLGEADTVYHDVAVENGQTVSGLDFDLSKQQ